MDNHYQQIAKTIFSILPPKDTEALIFGSRATGDNRKNSDIDIAIKSNQPTITPKINQIKEALENSNIPYIVDIVDLSTVSDQFKQVALKKTINLHKYL